MRYRETGELHKDFHGALNTTVDYVVGKYGRDALREIFRRVGREVYRSIHAKLQAGDPSELVEHLRYFYAREQADFRLTVESDAIVLEVFQCPAVEHLRRLGITPSPCFCDQTIEVNAGLCENTPWTTATEVLAPGRCRQCFTRQMDETP